MIQLLFGLLVVFALGLVVWAGSTLNAEYKQESEEKRAKNRDKEYERG